MQDILFFFIWFVLWTGSVIGIGAGFLRLIKVQPLIDYQIFEWGITGFIIIVLICGILNFFCPIWWLTSIALMIGGLYALFKIFPLKILFYRSMVKYYLILVFIFGTILIWFHPVHDTGGYHLVAINWIISQPIPFGLANLYSRLGFNTTWFLANACLEQLVFLFHRPLFITNGIVLFLYCSLIIRIFKEGIQNIKNTPYVSLETIRLIISRISAGDLFLILSIFPAVDITRRFVSTASPDMVVFLFEIIIISLSLNIITKKYCKKNKNHALFFLGILGILTLTIKTSAIPILLIIGGLFLFEIHTRIKKKSLLMQEILAEREFYFWSGVTIILIAIFILRGIIIAGNPFFPMLLSNQMVFSWGVPNEITTRTLQEVLEPARLYGSGDRSLLLHMNWVGHWMLELVKHTISLFIIWFVAIVGLLISNHCKKKEMVSQNNSWIQIIVLITFLIIAHLFWFNSAPDPRFGFGFLFSLPLVLLVFPAINYQNRYPEWYTIYISYVFILLMVLSVVLTSALVLTEGICIPIMPEYSYTIEHSLNGGEIYVSNSWDQIWDMPLPNTPEERYTELMVNKGTDTRGHYMFWYIFP